MLKNYCWDPDEQPARSHPRGSRIGSTATLTLGRDAATRAQFDGLIFERVINEVGALSHRHLYNVVGPSLQGFSKIR